MLGGSTAQISRSLKAIIKDRPRGSRLYTPIDRQTDRQTDRHKNNSITTFLFLFYFHHFFCCILSFSLLSDFHLKRVDHFFEIFCRVESFQTQLTLLYIAKFTPFFNVLTDVQFFMFIVNIKDLLETLFLLLLIQHFQIFFEI
jgi:hypothetical protein